MKLVKMPNFSTRAHVVLDLWQFKNMPFVYTPADLKTPDLWLLRATKIKIVGEQMAWISSKFPVNQILVCKIRISYWKTMKIRGILCILMIKFLLRLWLVLVKDICMWQSFSSPWCWFFRKLIHLVNFWL